MPRAADSLHFLSILQGPSTLPRPVLRAPRTLPWHFAPETQHAAITTVPLCTPCFADMQQGVVGEPVQRSSRVLPSHRSSQYNAAGTVIPSQLSLPACLPAPLLVCGCTTSSGAGRQAGREGELRWDYSGTARASGGSATGSADLGQLQLYRLWRWSKRAEWYCVHWNAFATASIFTTNLARSRAVESEWERTPNNGSKPKALAKSQIPLPRHQCLCAGFLCSWGWQCSHPPHGLDRSPQSRVTLLLVLQQPSNRADDSCCNSFLRHSMSLSLLSQHVQLLKSS